MGLLSINFCWSYESPKSLSGDLSPIVMEKAVFIWIQDLDLPRIMLRDVV